MKKIILTVIEIIILYFSAFAANPESDFDYVFLNNYEKGWLAQVEPSVDKSKVLAEKQTGIHFVLITLPENLILK